MWPLFLAFAAAQCEDGCVECLRLDHVKEWRCIRCADGLDLWVNGCYEPCGQGEYRNGRDCEKCPENCDVCSGDHEHECLQCSRGYEFDSANRRICVPECPDRSFPDPSGEYCSECDTTCATCVDQWKISCTACSDKEYTLRILDENTMSGECLRQCDDGFFRESPGDLRCIQCQTNCMKCKSRYECFRDECDNRVRPESLFIDGVEMPVEADEWMTCHNSSYCVKPRTDCCRDEFNWYRGLCYPKPGMGTAAIDFQSYLASGAGIQWDEADAPPWDPGIMGMR
jgi:hypothetical protein